MFPSNATIQHEHHSCDFTPKKKPVNENIQIFRHPEEDFLQDLLDILFKDIMTGQTVEALPNHARLIHQK